MNAVGIDVSKGKSTVAVIQPFGVVIAEPFDVFHTDSGLKELVNFIKSLPGETKVVMEYTGTYYEPVANALHNAGIFVSVGDSSFRNGCSCIGCQHCILDHFRF